MNEASSAVQYRRISLVLFSLALLLGAISISRAEVDLGTYGLIHSLSPAYIVALFFLTASFLLTVKFNENGKAFLFLHLVVLVMFLYFVAAFIEATPRFPYVYHAYGNTEYILRNGQVDTSILTYQYWPGQQYLGAAIVEVTGLSPLSLLMGYPIALQLISLPLLYSIMRIVSDNSKVVWIALWLCYVAGWVNQGYYTSPANGYFLFLLIIFMALLWAARKGDKTFSQKTPLLIALVVLFAAIAVGHMLSSLAALSCLVVLYLLFRLKRIFGARGTQSLSVVTPWLLACMIALWLFNPLGGFLSGTPVEVPGGGTVTQNKGTAGGLFDFESNVRSAYESAIGSTFDLGEQHTKVMYVKVSLTAFFCGLPALGFVRQVVRRKVPFNSIVVLGVLLAIWVMPLPLGAYSGEMPSRVLGYSLPFLAFFAAQNMRGRVTPIVLGLFLLVCPVLFVASAYGNEQFDYVSPGEIKGVEFFYEHAPTDARVQSLTKRIWDFKYIERQYWERLDVESIDDAEQNDGNEQDGSCYTLLSERDIEGRSFLYGAVDEEKLQSIAGSPAFGKVYASTGFDLYLKVGMG
jgi:hypothetical protein